MNKRIATAAIVLAGTLAAGSASAIDVLGFYVGAGVGQSQIKADAGSISSQSFKENHSAWKVVAGVRPISLLGAEVSYTNFGDPESTIGGIPVKADLKGYGVAGLAYLPIPLPFIDVYGKAGYTRLDGDLTVGTTPALRTDIGEDAFTYGAGLQFKFTSWAIRGEYERFNLSGDDPSLWTIGITKTFF
ncbi:MAG: porin family protein [Steroidobacteraceae bacterium]